MRLLIITQIIDKEDAVLGFFHRWLEEFVAHFEKITVICLKEGLHDLPAKVEVLSLGKERKENAKGVSKVFLKIKFALIFLRYIISKRNEYDAVFVHMNAEYILLGSLFWKFWRKPASIWYNHSQGGLKANLAAFLSKKIFCTSPFSYMARFKKTVLMPVGIDTEIFKPNAYLDRERNSILFLGRIAPIKKPHIFIEALNILNKSYPPFRAYIYGDPATGDKGYYLNLKKTVEEYGLQDKIKFCGAVPNYEAPKIFAAYDIFVNLSPDGLYDKTIFEAMSSGNIIVSSHSNLRKEINPKLILETCTSSNLAVVLEKILNLDSKERQTLREGLREYVIENHDLKILAKRLKSELQNINQNASI